MTIKGTKAKNIFDQVRSTGEIAAYIRQSSQEEYIAIEKVEKRKYYSLSSAQQRLYLMQQMVMHHHDAHRPRDIGIGPPHAPARLGPQELLDGGGRRAS